MRVSLNSIKKLTDITIPTQELIEKVFTQIGAVEKIENQEEKYKGVLIAKILEKADHSDSDKLGVYKLDIGNGKNVQVVAGDKTLEIGDTIGYFAPGIKVPFNTKPESSDGVVSKVTLRGVESEGMMGSAKELDLGNDHTGIMRLDSSFNAGDLLADVLELNDTVLDIENKALANRGDCFGLIGIARELAAVQGKPFVSPKWYLDPESNEPRPAGILSIEVDNQTQLNCPRYMAIALDNVKIGKSPIWMQVELSKAGIKSINNVVDITNYLMILTAQPLHAFDYDKVIGKNKGGAKIVVRQAKNGETLHALNDKVLELDDTMAVICDEKNPIGLAGVIGGKDTEVDENTKRIILEVANFNRYNIRKTSWKLGIFTDAVTRYTKAQDPSQCKAVLYQAVTLLKEHASAKVASNIVDNYPQPNTPVELSIDTQALNLAQGLNLSSDEIKTILENIEYKVEGKDTLKVTVPTFRQDVSIPEDIYEDVARIYGFNKIEVTLPQKSITPANVNKYWELKAKIRNILSGLGANEILSYNFVSDNEITNYNLDLNQAFHIKNSLSPELEFMRVNLIPSLGEKLKDNMNRGYSNQALFEINLGHNKLEKDGEGLPLERWNLSLLTTGGYYVAKVYLDHLERKLNLKNLEYTLLADTVSSQLPQWIKLVMGQYNMNRSAVVTYEQESKKYYLGLIGELSNTLIFNTDLPKDSIAFEIDFESLYNSISTTSRYQEPSRFPKLSQDICFVMNKDIQYAKIKEEIEKVLKASKMYYELDLLDIYISEKQPELKQMTFRISLQSREKTLEGWEYAKVKKKVEYQLDKQYNAKII